MLKSLGLWQFVGALLVSLLAYLIAGLHGSLSSLAGSLAVWVGSLLAVQSMRQANSKKNADAGAALLLLLRAEAIKIVVIALLLWLTFKVCKPGLVPLALIAGLAVAALLSGVGIGRVGEEQSNGKG
jgi:ATP synthase protein I